MPLLAGKSKKAFQKNAATEVNAGKPLKQSLAIAYSMKRHAEGKRMAYGGSVETPESDSPSSIAQAIRNIKNKSAEPAQEEPDTFDENSDLSLFDDAETTELEPIESEEQKAPLTRIQAIRQRMKAAR